MTIKQTIIIQFYSKVIEVVNYFLMYLSIHGLINAINLLMTNETNNTSYWNLRQAYGQSI